MERASSPAHIAKEDVVVLVQEIECSADICNTRLVIAATSSLGEQGLAVGRLEPIGQGLKSSANAIRDARGVGAGVVRVKVLVDVEDWRKY